MKHEKESYQNRIASSCFSYDILIAACKKDKDNGDSTAPSESSDIGGSTGDETLPADASTEDPSAESTEAETVTDDSGKVVETKPADSGKAPAAPPAGSKMPSGTAAVLNYYNAATKAAFDGRVGFKSTERPETKR